MQRLLHLGGEVPGGKRDLRPLLPGESARPGFVNVPAWPGRFDIEIDCIAAV